MSKELKERASRVYGGAVVIDMLESLVFDIDIGYFRTLVDAGVAGAHFTVPWVDDDLPTTMIRIAKWYKAIEQAENAIIATKPAQIEAARKEGKVAAIFGMQNGKPFEGDLDLIRVLYKLGIRVIQPTYFRQNYLGAGCFEKKDRGLTDLGREAVKEFNRLGILIDASHCGDKTTLDLNETSKDPVSITHATPAALVKIDRAQSDEAIKAVAEKGGVIGQVIFTDFCEIKPNVRPIIDDYVTILEYLINVAGVDHVGLGLDYAPTWTKSQYEEYMAKFGAMGKYIPYEERYVEGFDSISDVIKIAEGLLARGYSDEEVKKILGGNWLSLLKKVWK